MADTTTESVPTSTDVMPTSTEVSKAVTDDLMSALNQQADQARRYYEKLAKQIKQVAINATTSLGDTKMADTTTIMPSGDGLFGAGGGGLIGGLILGSLLRNNGNLFGGNGDAAVGGVATQTGVQSTVNQSAIQQMLADIKESIPVNEGRLQIALANQAASLTNQLNAGEAAAALRDNSLQAAIASGFGAQNLALANSLASITNDVRNVGNAVQASTYATAENIRNDGDKTRALITSQYEATLNRQLTDANAQIIALQTKQDTALATRGVEVNTTNNINQMQQQQQQQAQFAQLGNLILGLAQQIRSTNEAINVGSGTLTANPTNTNTNIR